MKFQKINQRLRILLYLKRHGQVTNKQLAEEFSLPYQTIVTITSWWTDAGLLQKTAPEELKLGGPKYFFELTEVGETYLRQLYTDLHVFYGGEVEKSEPSETDEVALPPEVINSLMLNIPEYLTDLGISFTQEQYKRFTEKVKTFLEKEGVNIETYFD